eukprot:346590_1
MIAVVLLVCMVVAGSSTSCKNYIFTLDLDYTLPVPVGSCYISHDASIYEYSFGYVCEDRDGIPTAVEYYYDDSNCEGNKTNLGETKCSSADDYCECTITGGEQCDLWTYQSADDQSQ